MTSRVSHFLRQAGERPVADAWFAIAPQGNGVIRVCEVHADPYAVGDFWLVLGSERHLVVDSGSGIVPPAPTIEAIANGTPLLAVALNSFYDHAGGWHGFPARACHALDAPALVRPHQENAEVFDYLTEESLRALPYPGYSVAGYRMIGAEPTETLTDGDRIDLGDRSLEVLHLPGRTPGGIALWEAETGSLFTSDMLYDGEHGLAWPPNDPASYRGSLRRIRALPVSTVYPGHYGPFDGSRMRALINDQLCDLDAAP